MPTPDVPAQMLRFSLNSGALIQQMMQIRRAIRPTWGTSPMSDVLCVWEIGKLVARLPGS